jgi:hypothetical protein
MNNHHTKFEVPKPMLFSFHSETAFTSNVNVTLTFDPLTENQLGSSTGHEKSSYQV